MFGGRVGFARLTDRMAPFPLWSFEIPHKLTRGAFGTPHFGERGGRTGSSVVPLEREMVVS